MDTQVYIVTLKNGVDYQRFWHEVENKTSGLTFIPNRSVDIVHDRNPFVRICEYELTPQEADSLRQDPRVEDVEIPVRFNPFVDVSANRIQDITATGMNFTKPSSLLMTAQTKASINWGLIRHSYTTNQYGSSATTTENFNYVLDGTGVDVVINDSGITMGHPEFDDYYGVSRIKYVNWDSYTRPGANLTSRSYQDIEGHGTLCASITAGKNYGWAKNANIYPLYWSSSGDSSSEPLDSFEALLNWHATKGNNNPTVVNMSWDLRISFAPPLNIGTGYYAFILSGSYRDGPNSSWTGSQSNAFYQVRGLIPLTGNGLPVQNVDSSFIFPYSSAAYNAALGDLIDAGIIVCQSAGNNGFKIDIPASEGGSGDYNNYVITSISPNRLYYQRGASPKDYRSLIVGALDSITSLGQDQKATYSCAGPGVGVYAAGTNILGACSNTYTYFSNTSVGSYHLDSDFKEVISSGTSFASPQITGMCALYLQTNPTASMSQVKSWVQTSAKSTIVASGGSTSYTNDRSLLGGANLNAYQPLQGNSVIKNTASSWANIANVFVKTDSSTWTPVKNISIKTDSSTWKQSY